MNQSEILMRRRAAEVSLLEAILASAERAADRQRRWQLAHAALAVFRGGFVILCLAWIIFRIRYDEPMGVAACLVGFLAWAVATRVSSMLRLMIRVEGSAHHKLAGIARAIVGLSFPDEGVERGHVVARLYCLDIGFPEKPSFYESYVMGVSPGTSRDLS